MNCKKILFLILLITASLSGTTPERGSVVVLSTKVGAEINYIENIYYNIFPDVKNLYSAQIIKIDETNYGVRIIYWDTESLSLIRDAIILSGDRFERLKNKVDLTPLPKEHDINRITGKYVVLKQIEIFQTVPAGTLLKLITIDNMRIRGVLLEHSAEGFLLYDGHIEKLIPYLSVIKGFRIEQRKRNPKMNPYIYWGGALTGGGAGYYISKENSAHVRNLKTTSGAVGMLFLTHMIRETRLTCFPKQYKLDIIWNKDN